MKIANLMREQGRRELGVRLQRVVDHQPLTLDEACRALADARRAQALKLLERAQESIDEAERLMRGVVQPVSDWKFLDDEAFFGLVELRSRINTAVKVLRGSDRWLTVRGVLRDLVARGQA